MDIAAWLRDLGLERYEPAFRENEIDAEVLPELTEADLVTLGLPLGPRRKLLKAVAALHGGAPSAPVAQRRASVPTPLAEAERRQLTVMFCDLVGSTALAARLDPEELREVIGAYHRSVAEAVRRFDGLVAKYMGDGVLVYFGFPRAHEDDAERAVRAGLDIVADIGRLDMPATGELRVRIGIATGLVVVGDLIGEGPSQEQAVVGETPNLAARLQALAEPGAVVIAPATRRLIGNQFRLQALGRHEIKGLSETIEAWAVVGVSAAEGRFESLRSGPLTGFVGREDELGLLIERWNLARDGEGQVVLLSGEPGIGKSRVLSELRSRLEAQSATSLRLQCSPYYVNSAFYPIIENFERALRFVRGDTAEQKLDKLEALVVGQYGRPREDLRFIAAMLSIPGEERYGTVAMTPQKFKDETLRALADTTQAIARRQRTVKLFEDIHWADPTTLEVMDILIQRVRNFPLLIVVTHRPEFLSRWTHFGHVTALTLSKLTRPQSGALVSRVADGKALPVDLLEEILGKTDGVPLFVEELTKSLLESQDLRDAGDRWEYARRRSTVAIPLTLRDSLMARLDRFAPVREIAQIGAAIGRKFSYELIAAVAPHAKRELDHALAQLTASGLAFQQGTLANAVYTFKHALVQDAAYDSLLRQRRQELHGRIARAIEEHWPQTEATEPELLAHHYTEARQPSKAIPLWQKAGSLALARLALAEAVAHLNRGLDLVAALPASGERDGKDLVLRCLLGTAWMALKGWQAQEVWDSLRPGPVVDAANDNMSDLPGANFLQDGRAGEEGIDLALDEQIHRLERRIYDPAEVLGRIETDQPGHDGQQRPVSATAVKVRAHGPALQVAEAADLLFPEDLEATQMQTAQPRDWCAGIHRHDEVWCKIPAEIHIAVRDHAGNDTRIFSIGPAYMCFCRVYIADIGKALGSQQRTSGAMQVPGSFSKRIVVISGGGSAASALSQTPNPPRPAEPANAALVRNWRRDCIGTATLPGPNGWITMSLARCRFPPSGKDRRLRGMSPKNCRS